MFYGQILKFIELEVSSASLSSQGENTLPARKLLAYVSTIRPIAKNRLGFPYFRENDTGVTEIIDASNIECVVGRVLDRRKWAIIERVEVLQDLDFGQDTVGASADAC